MRSPAVQIGGQWWLAGTAGAVRADDPDFVSALDALATAAAAADLTVADLRTRTAIPPALSSRR
ncbi:hypothetical protein MHW47_00970 [Streptomyces sp. OfavH-34-F]|uniref:hypothetical protein n=1 Tax=Streptomyces sp. OfavH-34-F TaxID=2917760 RepID=UPI001EF16943|nr:hypothetical protein [Streptomyces sp. OfavH-34-F]MCG7523026.1 hypothetical protein [Streptomyces sp. OfavH-34-F]